MITTCNEFILDDRRIAFWKPPRGDEQVHHPPHPTRIIRYLADFNRDTGELNNLIRQGHLDT